jgi:hypothetical protein
MVETIKILESVYTVSGRILILIESDFGKPDNATILADSEGKKWKIINNSLYLDAKIIAKLPNKDQTFFCQLEPLGHEKRPETSMLEVAESDSYTSK